MIRFHCPQCGKRLKSNPGTSGKTAKCSRCQTSVVVPEEGADPATVVEQGAIDSKPIPKMGIAFDHDDKADAPADLDVTEKEKRAAERRARAERRRIERRAQLRTAGLLMLIAAGFGTVVSSGFSLVQWSSKSILSGTVTYEGRPIANGYITLTPKDDGPVTSARIVNGQYEIIRPTLGESVVLITAVSDAQLAKARPDPGQLEGKEAPAPPSDLVGPDAVGNNKIVTVQKGKHVMNFELFAPPPLKEPEKGEKR
ncbi:MAG: hypothetical protein ACJ8C4_08305 [Gemmataceae bacterium]